MFPRFHCFVGGLLVAVAVLSVHSATHAQIVDFEDFTGDVPGDSALPPESFYNGSEYVSPDHNGGKPFVSGGVTFNNYNSDLYAPTYYYWDNFAYSNMTDTTTPGPESQYSPYPGVGSRGSATFAIGFDGGAGALLTLPEGYSPVSVQLTNTTYTALVMLQGNGYARAFHNGDMLSVFITGRDANGQPISGMSPVQFNLADYVNSAGAIVDQWTNVNLTSLAGARELWFSLTSTDSSEFEGITYPNTPTYFALDDLSITSQTADVTGDGVVDIQDIGAMSNHWLQAGPVGDANGDGIVDIQDIGLASNHWLAGYGSGASVTTPVPEPTTGMLVALGMASLLTARRFRKR